MQGPNEAPPASRLSNQAAPAIFSAYEAYRAEFESITRRARGRFAARDWQGGSRDAADRLDLYTRSVDATEQHVRETLALRLSDRVVWAAMKAVYSSLIEGRDDGELAETYFNSVTRRIFTTVGVDPDIEFVDTDREQAPPRAEQPLCIQYPGGDDLQGLIERILRDADLDAPYRDLRADAARAADRLAADLAALALPPEVARAEIIRAPFFRRKGAYLIGWIFTATRALPLVLALLNNEEGVEVDALLTDENHLSILFSFAQSHFQVDLGAPLRVVRYLKLLMPRKPVAEIYIGLGHHKHGKTEMYRDLLRYVRRTEEQFVLAPGVPGMVMIVITLPGYDVVLKLIRDSFPAIKPLTAGDVRQNYRLVFRHDRAGRLVEAQEFEHLEFDRARFSAPVLAELARDASRTVEITDDAVVIHHSYIERRVTPLDVYLRSRPFEQAAAAVDDFGRGIGELAANGIFPGELLPKNFGVTRHGRVVCYDYDELSLLTDFTFRALPPERDDDDALEAEPWFGVGARDVFPEEIQRFLTLPSELRMVLDRTHPELYRVDWWLDVQRRVRGGEIIDIFPYPESRRLS